MLWLSDDGTELTADHPTSFSSSPTSSTFASSSSSTFKHYTEDAQQDSPHCEVLGKGQRAWLRTALEESKAPLKLIVSGSVLLGNPVTQVEAPRPL
jgi:hypothetical protein